MIPTRQSTALEIAIGPILDADGAAVTGGVVGDLKIKKTTGNFAALNGSATLTHVSAGVYDLVLTTSDTDTVGLCTIAIDDTVNACASLYLQVMEEAAYDMLYAASATGYIANQPVDVNTIKTQAVTCSGGVTIPAATLASTTNITAGTITTTTNLTNLPAITTGWITAAGIADGAIDRATFAADTGLQTIRSNTAQSGTSSGIVLDASASSVDDFYNSRIVYITGGTGAGQSRMVRDYTGSSKQVTIPGFWATNPDNTSTFAILPIGDANLEMLNGATDGMGIEAMGAEYGSAGYVSAGVALMGADVITAASIAADAGTELGTAVWVSATRTITGGTIGTYTGNTVQTGDAYARLGAPAGASVSADVAAVKVDTGNLVTRITSTLFSGITSMAQWLGLMAGKQTANSTALTEIKATGAGSGTYSEVTDSLEALRDNLATATALATAQTSIDDLPTNAELATALGTADDATLAAIATLQTSVNTIDDLLDTEMPALTMAVADLPTNAELATALGTADDAVLAAITSAHATTDALITTVDTVVDGIAADLPARITKNVALAAFPFKMVDSTDHVTAETGITVTATRSIDGAAFGACANAASEVSNGWYKIDLAAADLNGNTIVLRFTGTGCDTNELVIVTQNT